MQNKKPEALMFEYLKDIIYYPERASLDINLLPEDFKDLGEGLQVLAGFVKEQKVFAKTLLAGDFDNNIPSKENGIAAPLKEVHGILKHVVWQTSEVAKGDYNQKLEYFGQFSDSFNSMVQQLSDREEKLKKKNSELLELQELFKNMTIDAPFRIIAINNKDKSISYLNTLGENTRKNNPKLFEYFYNYLLDVKDKETILTIDDPKLMPTIHYYRVISTSSSLEDEKSIYVVYDVTKEILAEESLSKLAYHDELTGLSNRRSAMEIVNGLYNREYPFAIAFVDIDHLKYCNDVFGHEKGDEYIVEISHCLKSLPAERNVSRIGGDEFMVIAADCTAKELEKEFGNLHKKFVNEHKKPFEKSFSFGISEYVPKCLQELTDILSLADQRMYEYKIRNKKEIAYKDDRI